MTCRLEIFDDLPDEDLVSPLLAAAALGISEQTLRVWRHRDRGPNWCKDLINARVSYRVGALRAFCAARIVDRQGSLFENGAA